MVKAAVKRKKPIRTKPSTPADPPENPPLRLEWRSPGELAENPRNWRSHPEAQIAALTDVVAEVGWAGACLFNERTGRLIDGHARRKVALAQGTEKVPVLVGSWDEATEAKILATLDPLAAMATADSGKLAALLDGVQTGAASVQAMLDNLKAANPVVAPLPEAGAGGDEFDATPDDGPTRTKAGELWVIGGRHRLLVGDCTDAGNVERLMGGERALLCNTDPPYGIAYSDAARVSAEHASGRPTRERKWANDCIDNDEIDGVKLQAFLEGYIRAAVPYLTDNAAHYMWHPMLTQGTFFAAAAAAAADILIHRQIIWAKPSLLFGFGDYHWQHELCFYGWRKGHRPEFYGERNQTTLWQITHDTSNGNRDHPTQKPIELFTRPINNHTKPGELIYEPFAGSGSQFIAAHRLNRRCFGCEIEPKYADVILRRCEAEGLAVEKAD